MKYNELVQINESFQYSVNLQFDINDINKVKSYIPTIDGCEILKNYFSSIVLGKNRATTLIGPYGKGKSHLLLVLMTLVNDFEQQHESIIKELIEKIKKVDEELYDLIFEFRKNKKKIMPIIINSNYGDLNQAFLIALTEALERENINNLLINTYFDIALKVIEKWEEQYQDVILNIEKCLCEYNITLKDLKRGLKIYSEKDYAIFKNVYSCILHGQEFNPLVNSDILKTYKDITHEICKNGYNGIFIVFDEFSKFLEYVENSHITKDLKLLQDFAELADRTGKNEQIHINCITHKAINEYIKKVDEDKINSYKTVEGRFKEIFYTKSIQQNFEIISAAINKKNGYEEFFNNYLKKNGEFFDAIKTNSLFKNIDNIETILFKGCFPLNPFAALALINLSEKIAQNERTLFTFIADEDTYSLKSFINNNETEFLNIDVLYDYFKVILKKENNPAIKNIWLKSENAIEKCTGNLEKRFIKAVSIIYIINDLDAFSPTKENISLSLNISGNEYDKAFSVLNDKGILKEKKITGEVDFSNIYNKQLTTEIDELVNTKFNLINERSVIEKIVDINYSLPRRYNETFKMTRFFLNKYMTEDEVLKLTNFSLFFEQNYCDGIVINLIRESRNLQDVINHFIKINDERVVLRVPRLILNKININLLKEYESIEFLIQNNNDDDLESELLMMKNELTEIIGNNIEEYFSMENTQEFVYRSTIKKVNNLSAYLSDICFDIYSKTPIINNEMINKKELSTPIKKARQLVIDTILLNDKTIIKSPTSAEATIYKAVVGQKENQDVVAVLNIIDKFVKKSDNNKVSFDKLYNILENKPYSIRKGVIPILISIALYNYSDIIVIYFKNREIELNSETLAKINENPENYYLLTEKGTTEKIEYIVKFMNVFNIVAGDNYGINVRKIVDTMKRWVLSLPRLTRELDIPDEKAGILESHIKIKKALLQPDINSNEFIFSYIPKIINKDIEEIPKEINNMKHCFDDYIKYYSTEVINSTKKILKEDFKGSLNSLLKEWYSEFKTKESNLFFDISAKGFIDYVKNIDSHDEMEIIEKISKNVVGYYIEDWQQNEIENYKNKLIDISNKIKIPIKNINSKRKIILVDGESEISKNIDEDIQISSLGNTMKNNIEEVIDEYGESVNEQEKINILINIMKKYM